MAVCLVAATYHAAAADFGHADRFPAVRKFLDELDLKAFPAPPGRAEDRFWCPFEPAAEVPENVMESFFLTGVRDRSTVLRLFALMADTVREQGVALCGSGDAINRVLDRAQINLGLSLPMKNLALYSWVPVYDENDPYTAAELTLVYSKRFVHRFREEVLPADIAVGTLDPVAIRVGDQVLQGYPVHLRFHLSSNKIGFERMQGVAARPHGMLGMLTKVLPFLPDAIHSMYLEQNTLFTKALVAGQVEDFEDTLRYQMHIEPSRFR